jgi:hypothetical protein
MADQLFEIESAHFKKIEEYINQKMYMQNADKTGMVDFERESLGAYILSTRFDAPQNDNTKQDRWFYLFYLPIKRVSVEPDIVIKGFFNF